jgi:hypothetical protein
MPGPRGPNACGTPGETEEENMQRVRDAIAHNERYFAKYPQAANSEPNAGTQRPGTPDGSLETETRKPGSLK